MLCYALPCCCWFVTFFGLSLKFHPNLIGVKAVDDTIPNMPILMEHAACDAFDVLEKGYRYSMLQKIRCGGVDTGCGGGACCLFVCFVPQILVVGCVREVSEGAEHCRTR